LRKLQDFVSLRRDTGQPVSGAVLASYILQEFGVKITRRQGVRMLRRFNGTGQGPIARPLLGEASGHAAHPRILPHPRSVKIGGAAKKQLLISNNLRPSSPPPASGTSRS
jgi:hypothetical protein